MIRAHLLGKPFVERDGERLPGPRGRKAWALLAYLGCTRTAHTREHLASILFADAEDPLAALRWNLTEVRRMLDAPASFKGDHVSLPDEVELDVRILASRGWQDAIALPGIGGVLLEGMHFASSAALDAWLLGERWHQQAVTSSVLREAALASLGSGSFQQAISLAARLVASNPFEEPNQELLIRSYVVSGDRRSGHHQLAACIELFRKELGIEPGAAVYAALDAAVGTAAGGPEVSGSASARAQLDAGRAAIDAGAIDPGIACLRRAASEAQTVSDGALRAEALVALGSALVHLVRGRDGEGAAVLHEAIALCEPQQGATQAEALAELAWIDVLAGRHERGMLLLDRAAEIDEISDTFRAKTEAMRAAALLDQGRCELAGTLLVRALEVARQQGDRRLEIGILGELTRYELLAGTLRAARAYAAEALQLAERERATTEAALVRGVLGTIAVMDGDVSAETHRHLEHAFALGCQVGDPCAESVASHGLGLLRARSGDWPGAVVALREAVERCRRRGNASIWLEAWALDSLCAAAVEAADPRAATWSAELEELAARAGLKEFLARSYLHRARLGDVSTLALAARIAEEDGSPNLREQVAQAERSQVATGM